MIKRYGFVLLLLFTILAIDSYGQQKTHQPLPPSGHGTLNQPPPTENCLPQERVDAFAKYAQSQSVRTQGTTSVLYEWPLEDSVNHNNILVNYVDLDPTTAVVDYMGLPHSYDGHNGTDITLYHFRAMDKGVKVIAAADGIVSSVVNFEPDRHMGPPYLTPENNVIVLNNDGTYTWYLHFRRNATTVIPGETITTGTVLGLAGSSGFSTDAHLHFETGEYISNVWNRRDPWNGTNQPLPSLWRVQEPYVGLDHLKIYDMGMFTQTTCGGNQNNIPASYYKERFTQPVVIGINEPIIGTWFLLHGQPTDAYHLEFKKPNNAVFGYVDYTLGGKYRYGWNYWWWNFAGYVSAADYGTWHAVVSVNGTDIYNVPFEVGPTTVYAPRFSPISGRSFRINGSLQRDTLRVSSLGGPVTYSLHDAPGTIGLVNDSIVTIGGTSTQSSRSYYFEAIATDGAGRTDTMWYHLIDTTKENNAFGDLPAALAIKSGWNLLSMPVRIRDSRRTVLFPTAQSNAYTYINTYITKDTLRHGEGYWLKYGNDENIVLTAPPITSDTVDVRLGWNMVGSVSKRIAASTIQSIPGGITASQFYKYSSGSGYSTADTIEPGVGYWVKVSQSGQIVLGSSSLASTQNTLVIDAKNKELPPSPPEGVSGNDVPYTYSLSQNYPNPFNPETHFEFSIADLQFVSLDIYNLLGQKVATVVAENLPPGTYARSWNAEKFSSGMYFYRLTSGRFTETKKLILIK